MRNSKVILVCLIHLIFSCTSSHKNETSGCEKYKTGLYVYYYPGSFHKRSLFIERNDSMQIESGPGNTTYLNVKWLDPCTYELTYESSTFVLPDSLYKLKRDYPVRTRIVKAEEKYYIFESGSDFDNSVLKDTVWRLRH